MLINGSGSLVHPVRTVRNLGVFDADLVMRSRVSRVIAQCFAVLRQMRLISRLLSPSTLKTVVVALVLSRLDYANSVLTGLPAYLVKRLQSVFNASTGLIHGLRRFDHVSNALMWLHWLRIPERIRFKLAVLVHRVLHGNAPEYLTSFTRLTDAFRADHLFIPPVRRSTVGARAFMVSVPTLWNSLPSEITSIDSLPVFRRRQKLIYSRTVVRVLTRLL